MLFKTFRQFISESKLPYSIELSIKSQEIKWKEDKTRIDELKKEQGKEIKNAKVYIGESIDQKINYLLKTWLKSSLYGIQLEENETTIFFQEYSMNEKRYYDQDCENILGFTIKN